MFYKQENPQETPSQIINQLNFSPTKISASDLQKYLKPIFNHDPITLIVMNRGHLLCIFVILEAQYLILK